MFKRKAGVVCSASTCGNKTYNCDLRFFGFPKDEERARIWLLACGREDLLQKNNKLSSYRLCSAHFEDRMYINDLKSRLLPKAIPTIFSDDLDAETFYTVKMEPENVLSRREKVKMAVQKYRAKINLHEDLRKEYQEKEAERKRKDRYARKIMLLKNKELLNKERQKERLRKKIYRDKIRVLKEGGLENNMEYSSLSNSTNLLQILHQKKEDDFEHIIKKNNIQSDTNTEYFGDTQEVVIKTENLDSSEEANHVEIKLEYDESIVKWETMDEECVTSCDNGKSKDYNKPELISHPYELPLPSESILDTQDNWKTKLFADLNEIKTTQTIILNRLSKLEVMLKEEKKIDSSSIFPELPLQCFTTLLEFENKLKEEGDINKNFISYLQLLSTNELHTSIQRIMACTYSEKLAAEMSWTGYMKSIGFDSFIQKNIFGVVKKMFPNLREEQFREEVTNWLQNRLQINK